MFPFSPWFKRAIKHRIKPTFMRVFFPQFFFIRNSDLCGKLCRRCLYSRLSFYINHEQYVSIWWSQRTCSWREESTLLLCHLTKNLEASWNFKHACQTEAQKFLQIVLRASMFHTACRYIFLLVVGHFWCQWGMQVIPDSYCYC